MVLTGLTVAAGECSLSLMVLSASWVTVTLPSRSEKSRKHNKSFAKRVLNKHLFDYCDVSQTTDRLSQQLVNYNEIKSLKEAEVVRRNLCVCCLLSVELGGLIALHCWLSKAASR